MRSDMAQVVTEKPRSGGRVKTPKGSKKEYQWEVRNECEKHREKIRLKWDRTYYEKQFTDVLGPIVGYLRKQVGRKWDHVFSDICHNLPNNSLNTSHVRDHIKGFVETDVILIDGVPYESDGIHKIEGYSHYPQFYVHPVTGILCKLENHRKYRYRRDIKKIGKDVPGEKDKQYHCVDGVWYILTLRKAVYLAYRYTSLLYDMGYKMSLDKYERQKLYGDDLYCFAKTQLNKKEIKKAGLK